MTIAKTYDKLKKAENYQNRLYSRYEYVRLIAAPMFSEGGRYVWEVRNPK